MSAQEVVADVIIKHLENHHVYKIIHLLSKIYDNKEVLNMLSHTQLILLDYALCDPGIKRPRPDTGRTKNDLINHIIDVVKMSAYDVVIRNNSPTKDLFHELAVITAKPIITVNIDLFDLNRNHLFFVYCLIYGEYNNGKYVIETIETFFGDRYNKKSTINIFNYLEQNIDIIERNLKNTLIEGQGMNVLQHIRREFRVTHFSR